jgi:hypothetical protein
MDCTFCRFLTAPTWQIGLACWVIVCFDGGLWAAAEYLTDIGCAEGAFEIYDCLKHIVDEYGDEVPSPPSLPF